MYDSTGNILHINLSTRKIWMENPSKMFIKKYLGERATNLYYMLKNTKPGTGALSQDNIPIFTARAILRTPAPDFQSSTP